VTGGAAGQVNPVYVDDSPRAWELLQRATDQSRDNAGEAIRLYQELLDDYALKLVPVTDAATDHFVSVRRRVLAALAADPELLERYRLIEAAEAGRLLEAGELGQLARTRPLTEPGLDALLRLAQRDFESARFRSARRWLGEAVEHPDLEGRRSVHAWLLLGQCAHYLDDDATRERALAALEAAGPAATAARQELERLAGDPPASDAARGVTVMDAAAASDLTDLVAQEIWSIPLEDSLLNRRFADPTTSLPPRGPAFERRRAEADLTTSAPTVAGQTVYVNQGYSVVAISRLTGRVLWTHVDRPKLAVIDRDNEQTMDLNVVAVGEGSLVTLTGHAAMGGRSSQGRVICLEPETGRLRWSRTLDRIGGIEEHAGLFPHGAPIIADGRVFLLARKISRQLLTSCYVVALDLDDGRLAWTRHVASSGGVRRSGRSFSTIVRDDGDLFIATAVGGIARLDGVTGDLRWLQRFNVPVSPTSHDQERRPWEISAPVVTPRGVVALQPDQRRVVLLDRETGDVLESHASVTRDGWASPTYLLASDRAVYAVGREIRAFDVHALDQPLWQLPAPAQQTSPDIPAAYTRLPIRGRVQIVAGALIVPTLNGILVVDDETGQVIHRLATGTIGNPLAVEAQLLLAGGDRLDAYMSFGRAERLLRERIASVPEDAEPALSLLRLGLRVRDLELALEAAELAMAAINAAGDGPDTGARDELFSTLQAIAGEDIVETVDEGEALFALMGAVAGDTSQRVEHRLGYGDWIAEFAVERAVESYQQVLSDATLAAVWRAESGRVRPAAAWASRRLADLVTRLGPDVYATLAHYASLQLEPLLAVQEPDPAALLALAREFPLSPAAIEAVFVASETSLRRGDRRAALAALTEGSRLAADPAQRGLLLGRLVEVCVDAGMTEQAEAILRWAGAAEPPQPLAAAEGPRRPEDWLAAVAPPAPRAALGAHAGLAEVRDGRLVPLEGRGRDVWPHAALLVEGSELACLEAESLAVRWTTTLDGDSPEVLRFTDDELLLWFGADQDDPRIVALDPRTGDERWTTPRVREHLGDPVRDLSQARDVQAQMANGRPFDPGESLVRRGSRSLVIVRRTGGVIAFAPTDGAVLWSVEETLDEVHLARLHDYGLILAGLERQVDVRGEVRMAPRVLVLDPDKGTTLHDFQPRSRSAVIWQEVSPLGTLVYGTADGIELFDLLGGRRRMANITYAAMGSQRAWTGDESIVVRDRVAGLRALDPETGDLGDPFAPPTHGEWDPLDLRAVRVEDGRVYVRYKQRVVRFDDTGAVLGADVVSDDRDYRWLVPTADRLLVLSSRTEQSLIPDREGRRTQYIYRIYPLSENCKLLGEPLELKPFRQRVDTITAVNGWLLLSTHARTVAIPFPVER
jgi:outer membrane protein assembly factor BamB